MLRASIASVGTAITSDGGVACWPLCPRDETAVAAAPGAARNVQFSQLSREPQQKLAGERPMGSIVCPNWGEGAWEVTVHMQGNQNRRCPRRHGISLTAKLQTRRQLP